MSCTLTSFDFDGQQLSAVIDEQGNAWFIAAIVCEILGYNNTSQAVTSHVHPKDKGYVTIEQGEVIGGISDRYTPSQSLVINEAGLYRIILRSGKPYAETFREWITSEVLPTIHRSGSYSLQQTPSTPAELILAQAQVLVSHERKLIEHDNKLADHTERLAVTDQRVNSLEARANARDKGSEYYTVLAYSNLNGLSCTNDQALLHGRRAAALSRTRNIPIGKAPDTRYGQVNSYHVTILDEIFGNNRKN
jgi:prophage antirepressor-like protein